MNIFKFPLYEILHHPVSDVGFFFIVVTAYLIYKSYKKYINYRNSYLKSHNSMNLKAWAKKYRKLLIIDLGSLFLSMILARPLFTYYSDIIEWLGIVSFIVALLQIQQHIKNLQYHKRLWDIITSEIYYYNHTHIIAYVQNNLGLQAANTTILVHLGITPFNNGKPKAIFGDFYIKSFELTNSNVGSKKFFINDSDIYNIFKDKFDSKGFGKYYCILKFQQQDNQKNCKSMSFIYYFGNKQSSHVQMISPNLLFY